MAKVRDFVGQDWIIKPMKKFGYPSDDDGVCFGLSHLGMQSFLADDLDTYSQLADLIYDIALEVIQAEVNQAKKRRINFYAEAKAEALQEVKLHVSKLTSRQKALLSHLVHQKLDKKLEKLTDKERMLVNIPAYLEQVELFQQASEYPHLFEKGKPHFLQKRNVLLLFEMFKHPVLVKEGGVVRLDPFIGSYNKNDLILYFQSFLKAAESSKFRISLMLNSSDHGIHAGYDDREQKWALTEPIKSPLVYIFSTDELIEKIMNGFSDNGTVVFETNMYVTKRNEAKAKAVMKAWKQDKNWQEIHDYSSRGVQQVDSNDATLLYLATKNSDFDLLQKLLILGADVNKPIKQGFTPLYMAAVSGNLNVVKELIAYHADIEKSTSIGSTPIHTAVHHGQFEVVKLLIAAGANVNKATTLGLTVLHIAAANGNLNILKELIKAGANIAKATNDGMTALHYAAENGHLEVINLLLDVGVPVDHFTKIKTENLLTFAKEKGHAQELEELIKRKSLLNKVLDELPYFTPLHMAIVCGRVEVVKFLLQKGADIEQKTMSISVFELARVMNYPEITKILEDHLVALQARKNQANDCQDQTTKNTKRRKITTMFSGENRKKRKIQAYMNLDLITIRINKRLRH